MTWVGVGVWGFSRLPEPLAVGYPTKIVQGVGMCCLCKTVNSHNLRRTIFWLECDKRIHIWLCDYLWSYFSEAKSSPVDIYCNTSKNSREIFAVNILIKIAMKTVWLESGYLVTSRTNTGWPLKMPLREKKPKPKHQSIGMVNEKKYQRVFFWWPRNACSISFRVESLPRITPLLLHLVKEK